MRQQCFANHAQADCNAYGFDEYKINLGLELEKKASTHIIQRPGLSGSLKTPSDTFSHLCILSAGLGCRPLVWPTD
jgi:hypothetical protein